MKWKITLVGILVLGLILSGCKSAVEPASEASQEELAVDDGLKEMEELDQLDRELDLDFEEVEGYVK